MKTTSNFKKIISVWKTVYSNKYYLIIAAVVAIIFYLINVFIVQINNIKLFTLNNTLIFLTSGFYYLVTRITFYSTIIISLLTGILVSLIAFKIKNFINSASTNIIASIGIILAALVPGCASCGIGLAAVLGLSSSLFYLPFKGTEIAILSILILTFAIIKTTLNLLECKLIK